MRLTREQYRLIAKESLSIMKNGYYDIENERISFDKTKCSNAIIYGPDWERDKDVDIKAITKVFVTPLDTVSSILTRTDTTKTMVLNFASAKRPGGGFENGAVAQEEALARSSTLYLSIGGKKAREMYLANAEVKTPFYTEHMAYSPTVLFFRDADNKLIKDYKYISVLSAPAVNRSICNKNDAEINDIMRKRIRKIFDIAIENEKDDLILGAWGCGVFGNIPETVAILFKKH